MDKVSDEDIINSSTLIVITSTTGDGEHPENALPFWKRLGASKDLSHIKYTILGLGDSNYTQYCNGPKRFNARLLSKGAETFYDPGWADDGVGLEIVVEPWIENLWSKLDDILRDTTSTRIIGPSKVISKKKKMDGIKNQLSARFGHIKATKVQEKLDGLCLKKCPLKTLAFNKEETLSLPSPPGEFLKLDFIPEISKNIDEEEPSPHFSLKHDLHRIFMDKSRKLTSDGAVKDVYEITFKVPEESAEKLNFSPGDAFDIVVPNPDEEVDAIISLLDIDSSHTSVRCIQASLLPDCKKSAKIPDFLNFQRPFSLREVLKNGVEIRTVPKKPFVRMLVDHTCEPEEKRRLEELCSRQGGSNYLSVVRGGNINLLDILITFPSCKPPVERVLEHLPALQARPYSISSFQDVQEPGDKFYDVVFSLVDVPQDKGRQFPRKGISTGFLHDYCSNSESGKPIYIYKRTKKSFNPPSDLRKPYIMIGAGTGVAPYRGFMQERKQRFRTEVSGSPITWLIFGCRNKDKDLLYAQDWIEFSNDPKILGKMDVVFSRDTETKRYVQDLIGEHGKEFAKKILEDDALIYVCGDALNMAKDVQEKIIQVLHTHSNLSEADAKAKVAEMRIKDQYLQDIWT